MKCVYLIIVFILVLLPTGNAKLLQPYEYPYKSCYRYSMDFLDTYGGKLVFLQPDTYPNEPGHWMNQIITSDNKTYYIDWREQRIFTNQGDVLKWYIEAGRSTGEFNNAKLYVMKYLNYTY